MAEEFHRFGFEADDGSGLPRSHEVTLGTARVIVGSLNSHDAFTKMLGSIVSTERAHYDNLLNNVYSDDSDSDALHAPQAAGPRRFTGEDRIP